MAPKKLHFAQPVADQAGGGVVDYFTVRQFDGSKAFGAVIMVAALVTILVIVLYIIYLIKNQNFARQVVINGSINVADPNNQATSVNLTATSTNAVTYTFWVYLYNYVPKGASVEPGLVWTGYTASTTSATGSSGSSTVTNVSPLVFMDSSTNRMYCSFYLADGTTVNPNGFLLSQLIPTRNNLIGDLRSPLQNNPMGYVTIPIDYVPLQRWVHLALVINQSTISIYQDGTVYSVRAASDLDGVNQQPPQPQLTRPLFNVGTPTTFMTTPNASSSTYSASGPTIQNAVQQQNMYLSSFYYYNYALSQSDILGIYNKGPNAVSGWFTWLGLGHWKFQSPVVRIPDDAINGTSSGVQGSYS